MFGQLPAWHHPLPAVFSGCWPTVVQVYSDHSTLTGGGGSGGWLRGYWWADVCYVIWCGRGIDVPLQNSKVITFGNLGNFSDLYFVQYDLARPF